MGGRCEYRAAERHRQPRKAPMDKTEFTPVIRFVVTHLSPCGERVLAHAAQGRFTSATEAEAQEWINEAIASNGPTRLARIFGLPLEVRAVECGPGGFEPKTHWFE